MFEKYKTGTELFLLNHVNSENSEFNDSTKDKMFVYHHEETEQQKGWSEEELTDYRYIGANPNNWISFNGGTWRIIGVFTVENENGKKEKRMKLIRNVNITNISYDNKPNGTGSSESSDSSNDWTDARLMMLLNPGYEDNPLAIGGSLYWNRQSGKCPYGKEDRTADCDFTNAGFLPEYQEIIASTKWYLGGNFGLNKPSEVYNEERGTNTCYTEGNCLKERQVNWIGKVGLMYVSDYGYATSGSSTVSKEECLDTLLSNWSDKQDCVSNNWLFKENLQEWTLNNKNTNSYHVAYINEIGKVAWRSAYYDGKINNMRPAIYLISDIQITGTGSKDDPFVFTK